jgi:hypothetical protein
LILSWTKFISRAWIGLADLNAGFFARHDKKRGVSYSDAR